MDDLTYTEAVISTLSDADLRHRIPETVQHLDPHTRTIIEDWNNA